MKKLLAGLIIVVVCMSSLTVLAGTQEVSQKVYGPEEYKGQPLLMINPQPEEYKGQMLLRNLNPQPEEYSGQTLQRAFNK